MRPVDRLAHTRPDSCRSGQVSWSGAIPAGPSMTGNTLDAQSVEADPARERAAASDDDDHVVAAVRDERHDRHLLAQREPYESGAAAQVDAVTFGPGPVVVVIALGYTMTGMLP